MTITSRSRTLIRSLMQRRSRHFVYFRCRNLSVKICIGQSNKVKTSDKQMYISFCDNSFYCKISSDKLERRSDKLIRDRCLESMTLNAYVKVFRLKLCNFVCLHILLMDLIHGLHGDRYWFKILCGIFPISVHNIRSRSHT